MRLLLDTQLAIWWQIAPELIDAPTRSLVMDEAERVFVSRASLWEAAIKIGIGKLRIDLPAFAAQVETDGFEWLAIDTEHILGITRLPQFFDHKDPFDRLLVAQSIREPLTLLTVDEKLERYGPTVRRVSAG